MKQNPPLPSRTIVRARALRVKGTDAESVLWFHLRAGRRNGLKFRRQHPFPPYVVDFYCASARLVVELDGSQHSDLIDAERTRVLARQGIRVLRFWDNEVLSRIETVLESILTLIQDPTLTPTPLPAGEWLKRAEQ